LKFVADVVGSPVSEKNPAALAGPRTPIERARKKYQLLAIQINQCAGVFRVATLVPLLKQVVKEERAINGSFDCVVAKRTTIIRPAYTCQFRVRKYATFSNPTRDASMDGIKA
jgi:hypothetical protein